MRQIPLRFSGSRPARGRAILLLAALFCAGATQLARADVADLAFSSDGRYLACLDTDGNLYINDAKSGQPVASLLGRARGDSLAWRPGTSEIAVALDEGYGWDIYLVGPTGATERLTRHPAMDYSPQWIENGKKLVFVSFRGGDADLYALDMESRSEHPLIADRHDQWKPRAQPGGNALVYLSMEHGDTVVRLSETGKEPYVVGSLDPFQQYEEPDEVTWDLTGQFILYAERDSGSAHLRIFDAWTRENKVLLTRERIDGVLASVDRSWLFVRSNQGLWFHEMRRTSPVEKPGQALQPLGVELSRPALLLGGGTPGLAAAASRRGVALAPSISDPFQFFFFDLNDYLAHAERLAHAGLIEQAEAVYAGLETSLKKPAEIATARLHHAVQLRKRGRFEEALALVDGLARAGLVDRVQAETLRGEILFFELRKFDEAHQVFLKTPAAGFFTEESGEPAMPGEETPAYEPLAVLETRNRDLIRRYAEAHAALRRGDSDAALEALQKIVKYHAATSVVCGAVLDLLNNPYASESLSRPDNPLSRPQYRDRIADLLLLLERTVRKNARGQAEDAAAPPGLRDDVRERLYDDLFQALMRASRFEEARELARRMLQTGGISALDVPDFLNYYLESDRTDTYVHNLLGKVLLTPDLVPVLETQYGSDPMTRCELGLARIKLALLDGDLDAAADLLVSTGRWIEDSLSGPTGQEIAPLRYLLFLFAGKRFERLGDWTQAIEQYRLALDSLEKHAPDKIKLYFQIRASLDELEQSRSNGAALWQMQLILRGMGDAVLNATNEPAQLRIGVRNLLEILRTTSPSSLDAFLLYQIGFALSRCESAHAAAHYLDRALEARPPDALRAAILWEKAALFEITENWFLQLNALNALAECTPGVPQREAVRFKSVQPLQHLGMREDARRILETLSSGAARPDQREAAREQLEVLDLKP